VVVGTGNERLGLSGHHGLVACASERTGWMSVRLMCMRGSLKHTLFVVLGLFGGVVERTGSEYKVGTQGHGVDPMCVLR